MKRLLGVILALGTLLALLGCQSAGSTQTGLPQPPFPLEEEVVLATVEQLGLGLVLSEEETQSYTEGHIHYVFRHPTETYTKGGAKLMTAFVNSAMDGEKRFMQTHFEVPRTSEKPVFSWETWKQQLVLTTLLYGGFASEETLYEALSQQALPEVVDTSVSGMHSEVMVWEGLELPGGYCTISCKTSEYTYADTPQKWGATLNVHLYESKAHFEKTQADVAAQKEALENMTPEEKEAYLEAQQEAQRSRNAAA